MKRRNKQLLAENEYVKELLAVLKENPSPSGRDFAEMVAHVGELENRLAEAVEELRTMRQELLQVQNRSLKAVLQRSCKALEQNISNMSRKLSELKKLIGVSLKDLRDWCPLLSLQALLEVDNRAFPVEEWNRALAYLLGRPCAFSYVFEAKAYTKTVIRRWWF